MAFVGKVDRVEDGTLFMKTAEGKFFSNSIMWVLNKNALIDWQLKLVSGELFRNSYMNLLRVITDEKSIIESAYWSI